MVARRVGINAEPVSHRSNSARPPVVFWPFLCHNAALRRPAKGLPWRRIVLTHTLDFELMPVNRAFGACFWPDQESQMPKIKTKSGAKKRFKITGTGKVLFA